MTRTALPLRLMTTALFAAATLSACATAPTAEQICTEQWIKTRADKAVSRIEDKTQSSFSTLKKVAENWQDGNAPGPFQLIALSSSLKSLENELKSGSGIRDLKLLSRTCNDPVFVQKTMNSFMRDQGLPTSLIAFIENFDVYQEILQSDL